MTKTKKVIIATLVSFVLLLAAVAAGLNAVFTVTLVKADFVVCSAAGRAESEAMQEELNVYVGKSTTFLNLEELKKTVEGYPCFRLDGIEKKFPSTVELRVSERRETYAFATENGYSVLDEDGVYLYDKQENVNRAGGENVLLERFAIETKAGERAKGRYLSELFAVFGVFREALSEVRANVKSVSLGLGGAPSSGIYDFLITMHEGVRIELADIASGTEEKARVAIETYLSMKDSERVRGSLTVYELNGAIDADYKAD